jgi:iron-sulfur cluster assembly accessory protein
MFGAIIFNPKIVLSILMDLKNETKMSLITITEDGYNMIKSILDQQTEENAFLRIFVQGGCSGLKFAMAIDTNSLEGDTSFDYNGINVSVDKGSYSYVEGVTVDYDNNPEKPGFRITSPNPEMLTGGSCGSGEGSCGCSSGGCGSGSC